MSQNSADIVRRIRNGHEKREPEVRINVDNLRKTSAAYDRLKLMIANLEFDNGYHLHISAVSQRLDMSMTPVREALVRLYAEGLIDCIPGRGFFVKEPNILEQQSLHEHGDIILRHAVETASSGAGARLAAMRGATVEPAQPSVGALVEAHDLAHIGVVASSGNPELVRTMRNILDRTRSLRLIDMESERHSEGLQEDLSTISSALEAADVRTAYDVLCRSRAQFADRIGSLVRLAMQRSVGNRSAS